MALTANIINIVAARMNRDLLYPFDISLILIGSQGCGREKAVASESTMVTSSARSFPASSLSQDGDAPMHLARHIS
jgi:hypothetical protein